MPNGNFARIPLAQALDEIAAKIADVRTRLGPDAVAGFRGTMGYTNVLANALLPELIKALGSNSFFSTMTIDQSAKWVAVERLGAWAGGRSPMRDADVLMFVGTNPLVSLSTFNFNNQNPAKSIKDAQARGTQIIVIDPRESETAKFADLHLRPWPGEDATLLAGVLHIILDREWQDVEFCSQFVDGLDTLRAALARFRAEVVAARTGVLQEQIVEAAALFAEPLADRLKRGTAGSGTGPNMGCNSNLAEHLVECLNVICGRYPRAGDFVANPGVLAPAYPRLEQVIPPQRSWESGWKDADGFGILFGERMSGTLPDAMYAKGVGRVAALIVDGGNPVNAIPGSSTPAAFAELDLLVTIDPFMTETAKVSHYILPPPMMLERYDIPNPTYEPHIFQVPYVQYSRPVLDRPEGSELIDDWRVFWELGHRLNLPLQLGGTPLDFDSIPDDESMIAQIAANSSVPFEIIRQAEEGEIIDVVPQMVLPGQSDARFAVAPPDVIKELATLHLEFPQDRKRPFRFAMRRMREVQNTMYHDLPSIRKVIRINPVWMHPSDMADLDLSSDDIAEISSAHGAIEGPVRSDPTMRRGVVAVTHGWGGGKGVNVNILTHRIMGRDPINAMPVMTGFPVNVRKVVVQ